MANVQDMLASAVKRENARRAHITQVQKDNPLLNKAAATRVVADLYAQYKKYGREQQREQQRIDREVFRNKVSNIKIERAERLKAQKDIAREQKRDEANRLRAAKSAEVQKAAAVRGLLTGTRQIVTGSIAASAASVALLTRTAQHFSPATAIRFERAMGALAATVGHVLAPSFLKLTRFVEDLADWIANLSPSTQAWINTVVTVVTPLAIVASTVGSIALGFMTIGLGLAKVIRFARTFAGVMGTARVATAGVSAALGGRVATSGIGAWSHHASPVASQRGPSVAPTGGGGNLLPFLGSILGAQALVSSIAPQPERKPWHSKAPGLLGWTSDALRGGWTKLTTGRSLKSDWEADPRNTAEKRRLESANYPVQTMSSVLDVGRSFRQQSAQQSSLMSFEDWRQEGAIKVSKKDAEASVMAGLSAGIYALNNLLGQAIGELRTAR